MEISSVYKINLIALSANARLVFFLKGGKKTNRKKESIYEFSNEIIGTSKKLLRTMHIYYCA
jgi:hypothetical protein